MNLNFGNEVIDEGIWTQFNDDIELCIQRTGTTAHLKAKEEFERPYRKKIARESLGAEKQMEIAHKIIAKALLVDWRGVVDENGKKYPYSEDNAVDVFKKYPPVMDYVLDFAAELENFEEKQAEKIVKKSVKQLSGI